jgi:hypothetical protein
VLRDTGRTMQNNRRSALGFNFVSNITSVEVALLSGRL